MSLLSWLKPSPARVEPVRAEPVAAPAEFDRDIAKEYGIRRGMWVSAPTGVGIVEAVNAAGTVLMVLEDGSASVAQIEVIRQAQYLEIPAERRPDVESGRRMGYV